MLLIGVIGLLGAAVSAYPQVEVIHTDAVSRSGRRFVIRRNVVPKVKRANQIIPVVVGGPQDLYVPNVVTAAVGDIVQFQFSNGNHTVTQSAADQGCTSLQATVPTAVHSGHIPYQNGMQEVGTFNLVVSNTEPMFLYCATGPHCQDGQVMVINPQNVNQVVDYAKASQASTRSTDGIAVVGGAVGKIALGNAAFVPAPAGKAGGPPPGAPPAKAAPPPGAPPANAAPPPGAAPHARAAPPVDPSPPGGSAPRPRAALAEAAPAEVSPPEGPSPRPRAAPAEAAPAAKVTPPPGPLPRPRAAPVEAAAQAMVARSVDPPADPSTPPRAAPAEAARPAEAASVEAAPAA